MSKENPEGGLVKSSVEILLAEHQRLSTMYLHNVDMGEKRATLHLTLVSIGTGALIGLPKVVIDQPGFILWSSFCVVIGVFIFGLLTFQRLIERRIRAIEYLRAINRIHIFFVLKDPSIRDYFYWGATDDIPPFFARDTQLTGLRDIVACFNSLFAGIGFGEILHIALPNYVGYPAAVGLGLIMTIVVLKLQLIYEKRILGDIELEAAKVVRFPKEKIKT